MMLSDWQIFREAHCELCPAEPEVPFHRARGRWEGACSRGSEGRG